MDVGESSNTHNHTLKIIKINEKEDLLCPLELKLDVDEMKRKILDEISIPHQTKSSARGLSGDMDINKKFENEITDDSGVQKLVKKCYSQDIQEKFKMDTPGIDQSKKKSLTKSNPIITNKDKISENITTSKKLLISELSLTAKPSPVNLRTNSHIEHARSKIFETAEKFVNSAVKTAVEKPKNNFIPGVNIDGAELVFEKKVGLSPTIIPQLKKKSGTKLSDNSNEKVKNKNFEGTEKDEKEKILKEEKRRAVDFIKEILGKQPVKKNPSSELSLVSFKSDVFGNPETNVAVNLNNLRNTSKICAPDGSECASANKSDNSKKFVSTPTHLPNYLKNPFTKKLILIITINQDNSGTFLVIYVSQSFKPTSIPQD